MVGKKVYSDFCFRKQGSLLKFFVRDFAFLIRIEDVQYVLQAASNKECSPLPSAFRMFFDHVSCKWTATCSPAIAERLLSQKLSPNIPPSKSIFLDLCADVAQMVEQLIRNQ